MMNVRDLEITFTNVNKSKGREILMFFFPKLLSAIHVCPFNYIIILIIC